MFGHQKRQVPKPSLVGPHHSNNPMFSQPEDAAKFRSRVLLATICSLGLGLGLYLTYGPLFAIREISVVGTRIINPASVQQAAEKYVDSQRWLILPNRTLWILSSHGLASSLAKQIRQRISIEGISVTKQRPHGITIVISERTPVANWTNGSTLGSVDSQGMIIEVRSTADGLLPTIRDTSGKIFTIDSGVVKQEVMASFKSLALYMNQANIEVAEYLIPDPLCPTIVTPLTNTNSRAINTNRSAVTSNINRNVNASDTNTTTSVPEPLPCDREALRYSSQEIHAQLKDGPVVLFDRHANLEQSVQALKRVLSEPHVKALTSVDVRFGDRVYVQ